MHNRHGPPKTLVPSMLAWYVSNLQTQLKCWHMRGVIKSVRQPACCTQCMTMCTGKPTSQRVACKLCAILETGMAKMEAAYLTLAARLLMETRLICMGTSVAASVCSSSSGAVRLVRSSRYTISAARHTSVSLSEICKTYTKHLPEPCRTSHHCSCRLCVKLAFPSTMPDRF